MYCPLCIRSQRRCAAACGRTKACRNLLSAVCQSSEPFTTIRHACCTERTYEKGSVKMRLSFSGTLSSCVCFMPGDYLAVQKVLYDLTRIEDAVWIKHVFDALHKADLSFAQAFKEKSALCMADAVLSADLAMHFP